MRAGGVRREFQVWAAVDLLEGKAVRLRQGDPTRRTDFGEAVEASLRWGGAGLRHLHVVDLGAALGGVSMLPDFVRTLLAAHPGLSVQAAGGIRSLDAALTVVRAGAARVVLGSLLFERAGEARRILESLGPDRCVAALDGKDGRLRLRGWKEDGGLRLEEAFAQAQEMGFRQFLVTDIARDGEGTGPNLDLYRRLGGPGRSLLASGGVRGIADLAALASIPGVSGAVVGRALYEGTIVPEAIAGGAPWSA